MYKRQVIDYTEALISIDINSGRATKESDIESTALQTNLEAAEEIARQCRLRDMGGLIVIDFIDMRQYKNQKAIENAMRTAVRKDRARVSVGGISRFGLMEMSRQRLRPSLDDSAYKICPHCNGIGKVRSTESLALSVLRLVGEEARKEKTKSVIANIPPNAANYLINEKREWINEIEEREKIDIVLTADAELSSVNFTITRVRTDGTEIQGGSNTQEHSHGDQKNKEGETENRLNTEHEPVKAWDIEDMKGPNLMDKIKFWFKSPTKKKKKSSKKKQQPRKKASDNRRPRKKASDNRRPRKSTSKSSRKPKSNRKAKSSAPKEAQKDRQKQNTKGNKKVSKNESQSSKLKSDEKDNQKKSKKKGDNKPIKKEAKNKSDVDKKSIEKAKSKKAKSKSGKDDKRPSVKKKESKVKADKKANDSKSKKSSRKTSKVSKASSDKVLPWEDIVPPK